MARENMQNRIAEYVDSSQMTQRIKINNLLCCKIQGHYGVYLTKFDLGRGGTKTSCTCPSDYRPCKHALALAETYEIVPETFVDVKTVIKELRTKNKTELLRIIEEMIGSSPASLAALGIKGFKDEEENVEEEWE